jgi:PIN domain nuclease of toxin-antitoxin system
VSGVLLDTHTFLWSSLSPQLLSSRARDVVSDLNTDVYLSIMSVWKVGIKAASGKLTLVDPRQSRDRWQRFPVATHRSQPCVADDAPAFSSP